ncbi:hypothetical protein [Micromonospora endolithica]|uniref:hypothetical protein n=1 Tax=Micromonospora endolithica TaxID=230091 RepID=UPI001EDD0B4A|nr:hypothetical protein [Micromonospora endolithica]
MMNVTFRRQRPADDLFEQISPARFVLERQDIQARGQLGDPQDPLGHGPELRAVDTHEAVVGHDTSLPGASATGQISPARR